MPYSKTLQRPIAAALLAVLLPGIALGFGPAPASTPPPPAVAAASIIAREQFLTGLRELSAAVGVDLHKGAGEPVDRSAARFVQIHGLEGLDKVAKVHFKNTQKIRVSR